MGFLTSRDSQIPAKARILIIKTHAIGDLLLTTPAIRDIRKAYPDAHITLLVGKWAAPVIRKNPHIDEFMEVEDSVFMQRPILPVIKLLFALRLRRFEAAFIFHPLPSVHLFSLLAGIPRRYGLMTSGGSPYLTKGISENLEAGFYYPVNFQRVAALAGVPAGSPRIEVHADSADAAAVAELLASEGVGPADILLLVAPGGGRNSKEDVAAKRWPPASFEAVLKELRREYPSLKIALCGSEGDRQETGFLAARIPGLVDLTGRVSLTGLISVAGRSQAILCNDSAILHIGIAAGTPVVAPFGPTMLTRFVPPDVQSNSVQSAIACSPCYIGGRFPGCEIGYQCMREISPALILEKLRSILEGTLKPVIL